jgi:hypothetical protein
VDPALHRPDIDDVTDEVELLAVDTVEKVEERFGLAVHAAEVHVRDKQGLAAETSIQGQ